MTSQVINDPLFSGLPPLPNVEGAEPHINSIDLFKIAAAVSINESLGVSIETAFEGIEQGKKQGDLVVAVARYRLKGKPQEFVQKAVDGFKPNEYLSAATADGPFLVFETKTETLTRLVLNQVNQLTNLHPSKKPVFGSNEDYKGQKAIVEFSSPNIAKPFHAGHLRSTIQGMFVANLFEANGWDVTKMNYLGDWGKQYGLLSVGFRKYGDEEKLKEDAIRHLYDVYVRINADAKKEIADLVQKNREERRAKGEENVPADDAPFTKPEEQWANAQSPTHTESRTIFRKMEDGDPELLAVWQRFRDLSIEKYKSIYNRLNISFDVYSGESQVPKDAEEKALETLKTEGIVSNDDGALFVDLEKYKLGKVIVVKKDGAKLYLTRDIGEAITRQEKFHFNHMIYVVGAEQEQHFNQLFKICDLAGHPWANQLEHIKLGKVQGMSTRSGNAVFLEDIINEAQNVMHEQMKSNEAKYNEIENPVQTSDIIGITAIKIQDMSAKRINNYPFDIKRMTSFEGDTGPYLQYAHARLSSVERKAAPEIVLPEPSKRLEIDTSVLTEPTARNITILLSSYPFVVRQAFKVREPSTIVTFCFKLTHAISSAWEVLLVKNQDPKIALARLYLFVCAREVLDSAMRLLTLNPLERM